MKLLPLYSSASGLEPRRQWLLESFYPLPTTRYIVLHASSGMASKNYPLYPEVLRLILPVLNSQNIQVVQLGGKDDTPMPGCVHLHGKTDYHQSSYIVRGSMLLLGNDSWLAHRAGELQTPLVVLFGATTVSNHSPYSFDPTKTSFLESHRWGKHPTFAVQEAPQSIALIPPERVANEVMRLLGIQQVFPQQSRYWGQLYTHTIIDLIPNAPVAPAFVPGTVVNVRMDYLHNEDVLAAILATGRKVNIITQRVLLNPNILAQHRGQVLSYNHELGVRGHDGAPCPESDYPSLEYVAAVKAVIPATAFFTKETDVTVLSALRFRYMEATFIEQTKDTDQNDYLVGALSYLNREDNAQNRLALASEASYAGTNGEGLFFRSNKLLLSNNACYPSLAHLKAEQPLQSLADNTARVIDDPLWYKDLAHFHVYYQPAPSNDPVSPAA